MSTPKLGFIILSEAWYGKNCHPYNDDFDKISFGLYHKDGSTTGEMTMHWIVLSNGATPCLEVFDDAWAALTMIPNVIAELGNLNGQSITPQDFAQLLLDNGFVDMTPRENPYTKG